MTQAKHVWKNNRRYHVTDIGDLPGVTTILGNTKSKWTKRALESYEERVGKEVSQRVLEEACCRGDVLHSNIERYLEYRQLPESFLNNQHKTLWDLVFPLIDTLSRSRVKHIEKATHHSLGFAGSPDFIGEYKGKLTLFDWKNSSKPKTRSYIQDYILQVSAYAQSAKETLGVEVKQAIIVVAVCENSYLHITNPDKAGTIEPELQIFKVTAKQLEKGWEKFQERLEMFNELLRLEEIARNNDYYW